EFVATAVGRRWAGIECLSGIPGLVGATPIQNVGAYGQEVRETIVSVSAVEVDSGAPINFSNQECRFGYRESRFELVDAGRFVVVRVSYRLVPGGPPSIRYKEIERALDDEGIVNPQAEDARRAVLAVR